MSDKTAYFACMGCGDDRSYPAEMMGVTKDGDLWCWDCPGELFHDDDPNKPVLEKFVPEWETRIAELELEIEWRKGYEVDLLQRHNDLRKLAQAAVDNYCEENEAESIDALRDYLEVTK